jgi:hypothetical protein
MGLLIGSGMGQHGTTGTGCRRALWWGVVGGGVFSTPRNQRNELIAVTGADGTTLKATGSSSPAAGGEEKAEPGALHRAGSVHSWFSQETAGRTARRMKG